MSVNDDCIFEILSYLKSDDLHSVANVCSRLRVLAKEVFSTKQEAKKLIINYEALKKESNMRSHLHIFGEQIESICLITNDHYSEMTRRVPKSNDLYYVNMLRQYCIGTLKSLELNWFDFTHYENDAIDQLHSLFSGLPKLILKNCVFPIRMIAMCEKLKELVLFRTDTTNDDGVRLQLENLKTVKIEIRPIRTAPHFQNLSHISQLKSIEHLELDWLMQIPDSNEWKSFFQTLHKFKNLKTLRIYQRLIHENWAQFRNWIHLSDLVWAGPVYFSVKDLLNIIRFCENLEQLIVIFEITVRVIDNDHIDAIMYREMLDMILQRQNKKPLSVIIIGKEKSLSKFHVEIPMDPMLRITCMEQETVASVLNFNLAGSYPVGCHLYNNIKICDEGIKKLRDKGLIP